MDSLYRLNTACRASRALKHILSPPFGPYSYKTYSSSPELVRNYMRPGTWSMRLRAFPACRLS